MKRCNNIAFPLQLGKSSVRKVGSSLLLMALTALNVNSIHASPYSPELDRTGWSTLDTEGFDHQYAFDNDINTRWATGADQIPGQTFTVSLGAVQNVDRLVMITNNGDPNNEDYPRGYEIYTSLDGFNWGEPVKTGAGSPSDTTVIDFVSQSAAYLRIVQTGSVPGKWWSIHELVGFGMPFSVAHDKSVQLDTSSWFASASSNTMDANNALDLSKTTLWSSGEAQHAGQSFTVELSDSTLIDRVVMVSKSGDGLVNNYPRYIATQLSEDGINWSAAVASQQGSYSGYTDIRFTKQAARFIRFNQTGADAEHEWSIYDLMVFGSENSAPTNIAPTVSFVDQNQSTTTIPLGNEFGVEVEADDADGYVEFVSLFINNHFVGQQTLPPFVWDSSVDAELSNLEEGTYELRAESTDDQGAVGTTTTTIVVNSVEISAETGLFSPDYLHPDIVDVLNRPVSSVSYGPDAESWVDSYSVGDQCFCKTTFDHGIGEYMVDTPVGSMDVRQVCELVGPGPGSEGRPLYNDIQCGNGPSNSATNYWDDEDFCPGQINVGGTEEQRQAGCLNIGPTWKFNIDDTDDETGTENMVVHPDIVTVLDTPLSELPTPDPLWWGNSYSVGDQCFCEGALAENLHTLEVETAVGTRTVAQACALVGPGPGSDGHPKYNDVQCGNGPDNGNLDELLCPGQVNIVGTETERRLGCRNIGPTWKIEPEVTAAESSANLHEDIVKVLDRPLSSIPDDIDPTWWGDSYSVGDQCYCATTFDHGIGDYKVDTANGVTDVKTICELIGPGPGKEGRPLYNDVQCGNGPSNAPTNDYDDEDFCPGQINAPGTQADIRQGCLNIGPTWKF